jgi:hypothetical protein
MELHELWPRSALACLAVRHGPVDELEYAHRVSRRTRKRIPPAKKPDLSIDPTEHLHGFVEYRRLYLTATGLLPPATPCERAPAGCRNPVRSRPWQGRTACRRRGRERADPDLPQELPLRSRDRCRSRDGRAGGAHPMIRRLIRRRRSEWCESSVWSRPRQCPISCRRCHTLWRCGSRQFRFQDLAECSRALALDPPDANLAAGANLDHVRRHFVQASSARAHLPPQGLQPRADQLPDRLR